MRSHKLADFTDGKSCPASLGESVATLGPEATLHPLQLSSFRAWAWASGGTWAHGLGQGARETGTASCTVCLGSSPPPKYKLCDSTDHTYLATVGFPVPSFVPGIAGIQ